MVQQKVFTKVQKLLLLLLYVLGLASLEELSRYKRHTESLKKLQRGFGPKLVFINVVIYGSQLRAPLPQACHSWPGALLWQLEPSLGGLCFLEKPEKLQSRKVKEEGKSWQRPNEPSRYNRRPAPVIINYLVPFCDFLQPFLAAFLPTNCCF